MPTAFDLFEEQARDQAQARATSASFATTAQPDLDTVPGLMDEVREALHEIEERRKSLEPFTQSTRRREFSGSLRRLRREFRAVPSRHSTILKLRLAIAWIRFLLLWPILWRLLVLAALIVGLLVGAIWIVQHIDQISRLFSELSGNSGL